MHSEEADQGSWVRRYRIYRSRLMVGVDVGDRYNMGREDEGDFDHV
jgi:hypothetical protein